MKTLRHRLLFALALVLALAIDASATESEWIDLFDGETLDGWKQYIEPIRPDNRSEEEKRSKPVPSHLLPEDRRGKARFFVEDGAIVGHAESNSIHSYLGTEKEFADFEFECEVFVGWPTTKTAGMNSGIQIRSKWNESKPVYGRMGGVQVDIDERTPSTTGALYGQGIRLDASYPKKLPKNEHFKPDEWNRLRIVAQGPKIRTWLNDQLITDVEMPEVTTRQPRGFIGLQVHEIMNAKPAEVRWRNIRLRECAVEE